MQAFISKILDLKYAIELNTIEKNIRKKNVNQDNQLQAFISKIIELKKQSDSNKIENVR